MKIGHLHSWIQKDMWIPCDAIMIRHQWETWDYAIKNNINYWSLKYGKGSSREKLRDMIYNHTNSEFLFLAKNYDLIFLSMNFDNYPSSEDFRKFIKDIAIVYSKYYPNKEIILGAGNECFEKRGSLQKVIQTTLDTHWGKVDAGVKGKVCMWNEKIRTSAEKEAVKELLDKTLDPNLFCFGYQSLGTEPEIARQFIRLAQLEGYIIVDTEVMTETDRLSEIKTKVEVNLLLGVPIIFIGCLTVTKQLADYDDMFGKYGLKIGDKEKDKFKIIEYVQQFKDKKEVLTKMFDDIVLGVCYKVGTRGWGVKRTQKIFNMFIEKCQENPEKWVQDVEILVPDKILEDGLFGSKTKKAIEFYQMMMQVAGGIDGKAGTKTLTSMYNFMLKRYDK